MPPPHAPPAPAGLAAAVAMGRADNFSLQYNTLVNLYCHATALQMPRDSYEMRPPSPSAAAGSKKPVFVCSQVLTDAQGATRTFVGDPAPTKKEARASSSCKMLAAELRTANIATLDRLIRELRERNTKRKGRRKPGEAAEGPPPVPRFLSDQQREQQIQGVLMQLPKSSHVNVFAYSSDMWDFKTVPGHGGFKTVPVNSVSKAEVADYTRKLCVASTDRWGTMQNPGLEVALEPLVGRCSTGVCYGINASDLPRLWAYWRSTDAFVPIVLPISVHLGTSPQDAPVVEQGLTFVANQRSAAYRGGMSVADQARTIACARGTQGPNYSLLLIICHELSKLSGVDEPLERLLTLVTDAAWPPPPPGFAPASGETPATPHP
eukprot:TRINITY_DN6011_c0_g1_i1.p1 TRINITY_DN6011_c0_g1~~TRINITY_DN6011_c0_g1_i1.p1  ORF type:complete len:437 (+),score=109.41 TRINITY_DN6011_c0_g1_i1:180-1313(+)